MKTRRTSCDDGDGDEEAVMTLSTGPVNHGDVKNLPGFMVTQFKVTHGRKLKYNA